MNETGNSAGRHLPVLLGPVVAGLNVKANGCYVDGTFGRGGHASAILSELNDEGRLIGIDRDPAAQAEAPEALKSDPRLELIHGEFSGIRRYASERNLLGKVDGLLLDLGVSSPQLDEGERGFSFRTDGPLDMRMDWSRGQSAADWIRTVDEKTLKRVLQQLGEERFAGRIARAIVTERKQAPLLRTSELADIVSTAVPAHGQKRHPATKTFQAIRMFINDELGELRKVLHDSLDVLAPGGRLCVIGFHSLEDRLVKRFMRDKSRESAQYRGMPHVPAAAMPPLKLIGKAVKPDAEEIAMNPRARSARLRIAERL